MDGDFDTPRLEGPEMSVNCINAACVVVANHFNPSIFRDHWLVEQGILDGTEELEPGCIYTDMMVQLQSRNFNLLVSPNQLQFVPRGPAEAQARLVAEKVGLIVGTIPHTPFGAIGLNFDWQVAPEVAAFSEMNRQLFYWPNGPIHREFDDEDARFGAYFSHEVLGFRLKLDVKPVTAKETEVIRLAFNFHKDLSGDGENRVTEIKSCLQKWLEVRAESFRLANIAAAGDVK